MNPDIFIAPLPIKTLGRRIAGPPVVQPPATIVLEMREEVAETLRLILSCIGGNPYGRRGHTDELLFALRNIDVALVGENDVKRDANGLKPSIYLTSTVTL